MDFFRRKQPGRKPEESKSSAPVLDTVQQNAAETTNLQSGGHEQDLELARRVVAGDADAVNAFCNEYADRVYRYVISMAHELGNQDIEEIVQITMVTAVQKMGGYQGKSGLGTWVFSLARHKLLDLIRRHQARERREITFSQMPEQWDPAHEKQVADEYDDREFKALVQQAVKQLPAHEAEVLTLRYMAGLSTEEIAGIINKSERVTQKILTQARARIRVVLTPLLQERRGENRA